MFCSHGYLPHKFCTCSLPPHRPGSFLCWAHVGSSAAMGQSHQWRRGGGHRRAVRFPVPLFCLSPQPSCSAPLELGGEWGRSSYVWGMGRWESMILWRISSSQETKLSHLCPGAIWALSPGPARPPGSQSPKPHQRQPFVHRASHWTREVGGLDLGERKYFE